MDAHQRTFGMVHDSVLKHWASISGVLEVADRLRTRCGEHGSGAGAAADVLIGSVRVEQAVYRSPLYRFFMRVKFSARDVDNCGHAGS